MKMFIKNFKRKINQNKPIFEWTLKRDKNKKENLKLFKNNVFFKIKNIWGKTKLKINFIEISRKSKTKKKN